MNAQKLRLICAELTLERIGGKLNAMKREALFFNKVTKESNGCWIWTGSKGGNGYGQFWNGQRNMQAHWFLLEKRPTKGQEACHKCDNKLCVNPDHIFVGSRSDNMQDMLAKGRDNKDARRRSAATMQRKRINPKGSDNHESKLTERQAMMAKACPRKYGAAQKLATAFGVSVTVIVGIRAGKRWTHLPEPTEEQRKICCEALARLHGKYEND